MKKKITKIYIYNHVFFHTFSNKNNDNVKWIGKSYYNNNNISLQLTVQQHRHTITTCKIIKMFKYAKKKYENIFKKLFHFDLNLK